MCCMSSFSHFARAFARALYQVLCSRTEVTYYAQSGCKWFSLSSEFLHDTLIGVQGLRSRPCWGLGFRVKGFPLRTPRTTYVRGATVIGYWV